MYFIRTIRYIFTKGPFLIVEVLNNKHNEVEAEREAATDSN